MFTGSTGGMPDQEERLALSLTARRVDGLVVVPNPRGQAYLVPEIEAGTATVFVLRPPTGVEASTLRADTVLADERGGARTAVAHLISHGHRRIGLISGELGEYRARQLLQGYADAMADAGLIVEDAWTRLTAQRLLDSPVTAVFCGDRRQTMLALRTLSAADLSSSIAVIGFGDFPLAEHVRPGLTVISYDPVEIGRMAAETLFRRIDGEGGPARQAELPMKLVARGSGEVSPPLGRIVSPRSPAR
jgi:LacI family transcriptional regulator